MINYKHRQIKQWETKRKNGTDVPWNKGKKGSQVAWNKGIPTPKKTREKISVATKLAMRSPELREKLRNKKLGTKLSLETRQKMSEVRKGHIGYMLGKNHSIETRKKLSEINKGSKSHLWRGGVTKINDKIRTSIEYRLWREAVFARDNWTCKDCGKRGCGDLNAHHVKSFAFFPELRFAIDNGVTLCRECHKATDNYGRKGLLIKGAA